MVKKAAYGLLAAFLAAGVYGDIPTTAEDWYIPSGGFAAQSGTGTIYYGYDRTTGKWQSTTVTVDEQGNITGGDIDFERDYDLMTAYQALVKALYNEAYNAVQDEAIQTIGRNLHDLTSKTGIQIRNENTGQMFSIKFGGSIASAVGGSGGDIPATSDAEDPADNTSLDWSENGKLEIKGWDQQDADGSLWGDIPSGGIGIPVRIAYGGALMQYRNWYGVDNLSLSPDGTNGRLEISGWREAGEGGVVLASIADVLTNKTVDAIYRNYKVVVRNSSGGVNYVRVGELSGWSEGSGCVDVDGVSIVTNASDGAIAQGELSLRGYSDASQGGIPYKDASNLSWLSGASTTDYAVPLMKQNQNPIAGKLGPTIAYESNALDIKGFGAAPVNAIPYKKSNNTIAWMTNGVCGVSIAASGITVVTGVEWDSVNRKIVITRGNLAFNENGELYVADDEDATLQQEILTTPHSSVISAE